MALHGSDICRIAFIEKKEEKGEIELLKKHWPEFQVKKDDAGIKKLAKQLFVDGPVSFNVLVQGTDFQIKVWKALLTILEGECATYAEIAHKIGSPKAVRAVGTACGMNPIAFLIPCHRVLASDGSLGGYRWGLERKKALLVWEASRV